MLAMEFCHEWKVYKLVDNHSTWLLALTASPKPNATVAFHCG